MSSPITCADLNKRLWDGDEIAVTTVPDPSVPAYAIKFRLEAGPQVYWWKGIKFFYGDGTYANQVGISNHQYDDIRIGSRVVLQEEFTIQFGSSNSGLLVQGARLELLKAKFWGVHTGMYYLSDIGSCPGYGHTMTFRWNRD